MLFQQICLRGNGSSFEIIKEFQQLQEILTHTEFVDFQKANVFSTLAGFHPG